MNIAADVESRFKQKVHAIHADVTKETDVANLIAAAKEKFGGLDILVNNAGATGTLAPIASMEQPGWDAAMALLPRAAMFGMKHALPLIAARGGGSIINVASVGGMRAGISNVAYAVAKAAVIHLTRMAAVEFAPHKIRVNNICPGLFPTPNIGQFFNINPAEIDALLPEIADIFASAQPLKYSGRPEDIAQTALFLASDASRFTTGQDFVVDGGILTAGPGSLDPERSDGVLRKLFDLSERLNRAPNQVGT